MQPTNIFTDKRAKGWICLHHLTAFAFASADSLLLSVAHSQLCGSGDYSEFQSCSCWWAGFLLYANTSHYYSNWYAKASAICCSRYLYQPIFFFMCDIFSIVVNVFVLSLNTACCSLSLQLKHKTSTVFLPCFIINIHLYNACVSEYI